METQLKRFKKAREKLGLTLNDLGAMIGYHASTICGVENGYDKPSKRLSKLLTERLNLNTLPRKGKFHNSLPVSPPSISLAAAQNLSPEIFAELAAFRLEVVIVQFEAGRESAIWRHPKIEEDLDAALRAVRAGNYDSSHYAEGTFLHFFHVSNLARAMQTLKAGIEARGLLPITTILHGESHDSFRIYYPPNDPQTQLVKL